MSPDDPLLAKVADLVAPLAGDARTGTDLAYDPDFQKISGEIDKLNSLTGGTVDWSQVEDECKALFRTRTKDLRLAAWFALARMQRGGWSGLGEGITLAQALVDEYWEELYPPAKRPRARAGAVTFLWEALERMVGPRAAGAADREALDTVRARLVALNDALETRLAELNPGIGRVRSSIDEKIRSLPAVAPPPPPPPPPPPAATLEAPAAATDASAAASAPAAAPAPAAPAGPPVAVPTVSAAPEVAAGASLDDLKSAASRWGESLVTFVRAAREGAPADPWAYRALRYAVWLTIESAPEHEAGKTFLRPPRAAERTALQTLHDGGQWEGLVETAEDALVENLFWLDLHRFTAIGLERTGRRAAREALGREVAAFVARVPGLEHLSFSNGTPLAGPETVSWLTAEAGKWAGGSSARGSGGGGSTEETGEIDELLAALTGDDDSLGRALRAGLGNASARARFRVRLEVAKRALDGGRAALALDLLDVLLPEVTPTLERWEPIVAADALATCVRARRVAEAPDPRDGVTESSLFQRLLTLDPEAALRLRG